LKYPEEEEEGSAAGVVEGEEIIVVVAAVEEETEESTEAEEEEESIEAAGEEDLLVEVDTGKERDLLMVEGTDMRAGVHLHQLPPLVEKEIIIEKKGEDLHHVMGLPEDHHLLPGIVMVHHVEIMEALLLQGPQEDPMRVEDQVVEADMMTAIQAEALHLHPGTDTGAEVPWQAGIPHHMLVGQGLVKDTHQAPAIPPRAEAPELGVVNTEVVAQVMEEVEVTKSMKEVKEDIVEVVMNHPLELLPERNTLNQGGKEGDMMTEEIEVPQDIIAEVVNRNHDRK